MFGVGKEIKTQDRSKGSKNQGKNILMSKLYKYSVLKQYFVSLKNLQFHEFMKIKYVRSIYSKNLNSLFYLENLEGNKNKIK